MGFNIFNQTLDWRRNSKMNSGKLFWIKEHQRKRVSLQCVFRNILHFVPLNLIQLGDIFLGHRIKIWQLRHFAFPCWCNKRTSWCIKNAVF